MVTNGPDQINVNPTTSDQIKPNPTKKNGPARLKAQAVRSKLAPTNLHFGRARWRRGNAERLNGNAKGLNDRNTFFIYDTDERGSGISEQCSLMFAYSRLFSLNRRKIFMAPPWLSDAAPRFRSGCGRGRPRSGPRASSSAAGPAHRLGWGIIAEGWKGCRRAFVPRFFIGGARRRPGCRSTQQTAKKQVAPRGGHSNTTARDARYGRH